MKKKSKFVMVVANDWAGLYKDGKLISEGHSVENDTLAAAADLDYEELWAETYFDGYNHSSCPDNLSEIQEVLDALKEKQ